MGGGGGLQDGGGGSRMLAVTVTEVEAVEDRVEVLAQVKQPY